MPSVVCIASGGLDSICYAAVLGQNHDIYMITFAYGQRAKSEIESARRFAKILKAQDHRIVDISFMKSLYGPSNALTDRSRRLSAGFESGLVVPARNAVFISIAGAWALSIGAEKVAYGAHLGDAPHYPDCRPEFARVIEEALNLADADSINAGERQRVQVISPAAGGLDKQALLKAGHKILGNRLFSTWSCYSNGVRKGNQCIHCGWCESCINRKAAFRAAHIDDRTRYAA
jgi:7-cyano-7-deazaguanine synthase